MITLILIALWSVVDLFAVN